MRLKTRACLAGLACILCCSGVIADGAPRQKPLLVTADLNVGETQSVTLADGSAVTVTLLHLHEQRDTVRRAVRRAAVRVRVNGREVDLVASAYHLPVTAGGVQIDCAVTRGYLEGSSKGNAWALEKDARLRLWPAGSAWVDPHSFVYPVGQRWFASDTQMANVPTFVDGGDHPNRSQIYYHHGLDFGGPEGLVDVLAATDGVVVSSRGEVLEGHADSPVRPRYDVVYILDPRGWYYRYSHLQMIACALRPGYRVRRGERIGLLGKEGGSGGWSHLHFGISARQPSGSYGTLNAYPLIWEAYQREYRPDLVAVARPHHLIRSGETVRLDGGKSRSADGSTLHYQWQCSDGTVLHGPAQQRTYTAPGEYSEILRVTDDAGRAAYDFAVVQVLDPNRPQQLPPTLHAAYAPTFQIRVGDPVIFKVRSFRNAKPEEVWDFGDGSPRVTVHSDGNADVHSLDGYAVTVHRFARPGHHIVTVETENEHGYSATKHLHVRVGL
jgi:murein DD-endopeptidase MepM/ murein hydrolase activator NlpD